MGDVMCCVVCGRNGRNVIVGDVMSCAVCGPQGSGGPSGEREMEGREPSPTRDTVAVVAFSSHCEKKR